VRVVRTDVSASDPIDEMTPPDTPLTSPDQRTLPAPALAQLRWLVAALRTEEDAASATPRAEFALRLEQALIGAPPDVPERLATMLGRGDAELLVLLARNHEAHSYDAPAPEERTAHRGRARRYREIAQLLGLL
jgi:hypothetical protein